MQDAETLRKSARSPSAIESRLMFKLSLRGAFGTLVCPCSPERISRRPVRRAHPKNRALPIPPVPGVTARPRRPVCSRPRSVARRDRRYPPSVPSPCLCFASVDCTADPAATTDVQSYPQGRSTVSRPRNRVSRTCPFGPTRRPIWRPRDRHQPRCRRASSGIRGRGRRHRAAKLLVPVRHRTPTERRGGPADPRYRHDAEEWRAGSVPTWRSSTTRDADESHWWRRQAGKWWWSSPTAPWPATTPPNASNPGHPARKLPRRTRGLAVSAVDGRNVVTTAPGAGPQTGWWQRHRTNLQWHELPTRYRGCPTKW